MTIKKRCLAWDWTNTHDIPQKIDKVNFNGPIVACTNWNAWTPPELKGRLHFQPMIRTGGQLAGSDWNAITAAPTSETIHFFNEPERQADLTPQKAADIWVKTMLPLRQKGHKLVSPSCSNDAKGQAWITDFMHRVASHPPDFLGLHYYGTSGNDAIAFIKSMHAKFPKQPIMVTEIASIDRNYASVLGFTVQVSNWMDETEWVKQYAWFGCMRAVADGFVSPAAQLMKSDGSFTDLMFKIMFDQPMHV